MTVGTQNLKFNEILFELELRIETLFEYEKERRKDLTGKFKEVEWKIKDT